LGGSGHYLLLGRDGRQETMLVDARAERGIREQSNQVEFGKQLNEALSPVAITPTTLQFKLIFDVNDYG